MNKLSDLANLDKIVEEKANGIYTIPANKNETFQLRQILDYCKKYNKNISELSSDELEMFIDRG